MKGVSMIDDKKFLEHTELFEKLIETNMKNSINNLRRYLFENSNIPRICFTLLKNGFTKYSYFLYPIEEFEKDNVYVDKPYYELKEIETKEYMGYYLLGEEKFYFIFTLEQDKRYYEKINKLYYSFLVSNICFNGLDLRYIYRMYKIKIQKILDTFEKIDEATIHYELDEDFIFDINIYWNIETKKLISKKNLTVISDISYMYILDKNEEDFYLINEDKSLIEDVVHYNNYVEIYSKNMNLYFFNIFNVKKFDDRFIEKFVESETENIEIISLNDMKRIFIKNNVEVSEPIYENSNLSHLLIPNYNSQIFTFKKDYIYFKLKKYLTYDDVFNAVNILNLKLSNYEVRVYE